MCPSARAMKPPLTSRTVPPPPEELRVVEKVARMLPVQRRAELPAVQLLAGENCHFCRCPDNFGHLGREFKLTGRIDCATQDEIRPILISAPFAKHAILRETSVPRIRTTRPRAFSLSEMRTSAALISRIELSRSLTGRNAKSISTESRGRSSSKRLMAVPPFIAKKLSSAIDGMHRTTNSDWRR